jgi:hypothetical protein
MATMPRRTEKQVNTDVYVVDQRRPKLERFRLEVDRQTKSSFPSFEAAETAAKAIKKAHPVVQVSIYDAEDHQQKIIG